MKLAIISVAIAAMFGMLVADALFVNSVQNDVIQSCTHGVSYDKSGDMICYQLIAKNGNE